MKTEFQYYHQSVTVYELFWSVMVVYCDFTFAAIFFIINKIIEMYLIYTVGIVMAIFCVLLRIY